MASAVKLAAALKGLPAKLRALAGEAGQGGLTHLELCRGNSNWSGLGEKSYPAFLAHPSTLTYTQHLDVTVRGNSKNQQVANGLNAGYSNRFLGKQIRVKAK